MPSIVQQENHNPAQWRALRIEGDARLTALIETLKMKPRASRSRSIARSCRRPSGRRQSRCATGDELEIDQFRRRRLIRTVGSDRKSYARHSVRTGRQRFKSRLIVGTGKYKDFDETRARDRGERRRDRHGRGAAREYHRSRARKICSTTSIRSASRFCPTPPDATRPTRRFAPAASRARSASATW